MDKKDAPVDVYAIRRKNLRRERDAWKGPGSFVEALGYARNSAYITQLIGPHPSRDISEKNARRYELNLRKPLRYLDAEHDETPAPLQDRATVDSRLMAEVHRVVHEICESSQRVVPTEKYDALAWLIYDRARIEGRVDPDLARSLVWLSSQERGDAAG